MNKILLIFALLPLMCTNKVKSIPVNESKIDTTWEIINLNNSRIENLYVNGQLLEENHYIFNHLDSFRIVDTIFNQALIVNENYTKIEIDSFFSFYVPEQKKESDSFTINLWLAVERGNSYDYTIYKDSSLVMQLSNTFCPIIKLDFAYPKDSLEHPYYISKKTKRNGEEFNSRKILFLKVKNGKITYQF